MCVRYNHPSYPDRPSTGPSVIFSADAARDEIRADVMPLHSRGTRENARGFDAPVPDAPGRDDRRRFRRGGDVVVSADESGVRSVYRSWLGEEVIGEILRLDCACDVTVTRYDRLGDPLETCPICAGVVPATIEEAW
jgi:hypothetical protein